MRFVILSIALATLTIPTPLGAQPTYQIADMGPSDATSFCANPGVLINAAGSVVTTTRESGIVRSYLVDSSGVRTPVGTLSGGDTYATGVNSAGTVAGHSFVMFGNVRSFHAYIWTAGTGIVDLTPGASASYACGINVAGDVVGFAGQDGFVSTGGTTYDLNSLAIDGKSAWTLLERAISINDAGDIFGIGIIGGAEHGFLLTNTTSNLIVDGGFEADNPPNLGQPGWISDFPYRQVPAKSETNQPHSGTQNGACWATANLDCGLYQEVTAPRTVRYTVVFYAAADRSGGWVGANVNGRTAVASPVTATGFGNYLKYVMPFNATAGDTIRVWMYSPATPGFVVVDDVSLTGP